MDSEAVSTGSLANSLESLDYILQALHGDEHLEQLHMAMKPMISDKANKDEPVVQLASQTNNSVNQDAINLYDESTWSERVAPSSTPEIVSCLFFPLPFIKHQNLIILL